MCLKSQAICITVPLLWFFDSSGEHFHAQSSALCASTVWDVFVVCFCYGHKSPVLLPSLQAVLKADCCWLVLLESLYLLKSVQKIWYFMGGTIPLLRRDGWHCSKLELHCTFSKCGLGLGHWSTSCLPVIQHYSSVLIFPCPLSSASDLIVKSDCYSLVIKRIFPRILPNLLSPDDFDWCAKRGLLNPQSEVRSFYSSA